MELLGVPAGALAETLPGHLVHEITVRGAQGGPLTPLANQLNQDMTHLQGQRLEGMLAQVVSLVTALARSGGGPQVPRKPVRLPPRPVVLAGREGLLADLDTQLAGEGDQRPQMVALWGLGGAGKTSVAVEYAHRHLAEVGVAWKFPAEDATVMAAGFAELAAQLRAQDLPGSRDPVASVHAVLAASPADWLLVFDNAPCRAAVEEFLPPAGPGRMLVTSQSAVWPPGQAVEVPVLDPQVAAEFLVTRTGDADQQAARELATQLGGLPLGLEQAAAYIQATGTSLAWYVALFRDRRADLLGRGEDAEHPLSVAATLGLALSRLGDEAPAAVGLVRLLACLAPEPAPLALLLADARAAGQLAPGVADTVGPLLGDPVAMGDAVAALRRYSLVTRDGDAVLVHRLVQAITLDQVPADTRPQWEQAAATLVEAAIPDDALLPEAWPACAVLLPHARAALDLTSDGMWQIARYLGHSGSYPAARDLVRLIADAHREDDAYGAEHPRTLAARHNFAHWTGMAGDPAAARDLFAALLPIRDRVSGPEHLDTLNDRFELARWTGEAGDAVAARDQLAELLPIFERVSGPERWDTLAARHELASWTGEAGDAAAARDGLAQLLHVREQVVSDPEHPATLAVRGNLARWTGEAGDPAAARDQYAALLPVDERVLGPDHPATLAARADLAHWTGHAGDRAAARDQYAALLSVDERVLGPDHPDTLAARASLARWTGEVPTIS
jgi:Tetratricopeptide repeat